MTAPSTIDIYNKSSLHEEDNTELLIAQSVDQETKEKIIQEIIGEEPDKQSEDKLSNNKKGPKSKVGYLKEGYSNINGINPIDRYNFVIDRYNEEINRQNEIFLNRVPTNKILRKLYDLYIWICRLIFGVFLVIAYYFYKFRYDHTKNNESSNKSKVIQYKHYLFNDHDYFSRREESPKCYIVLLGIFFLVFSFYLVLLFFLVMLVPNILFTFYLMISLIIHKINKNKVQNMFQNMIYESKLDEKSQLNDYIVVDSGTLKYYDGFKFYEKLIKLFSSKDQYKPQSFMLYGDLFACEYDILVMSFYKQLVGIFGFLGIGYFFYL